MAKEHRSRTKAVITLVAVLLLTALLAYFLHLRPAEEMTPTPEEVGPAPEEVEPRLPGEARAPPSP